MIPSLDIPPTPIGLAVTASEQEVCIHGAVTVNTMKQFVQAFKQLLPSSSGEPKP
jgi:hypothetical protein